MEESESSERVGGSNRDVVEMGGDALRKRKIRTFGLQLLQRGEGAWYVRYNIMSIYAFIITSWPNHVTRVVIGPHKKVQVIMVRSLTKKWKQPIFAEFDYRVTKEILFNMI